MSEQAAAAREAFGIRLRDLRRDAGLTGRDLALGQGWHPSKVSRIERGQQNPSEDDIRAWCIACGAARQIPELIAVSREVEQMWVEYRREFRKGQKQVQAGGTPLYERTRLVRAYEAIVVPGILMTREYARAVLTINAQVHGLPLDEVEGAVDARLGRQHLVTASTGNLYSFLIEESVLSYVFGSPDVMREQLDFLLHVMTLPNVVLGVIPHGRVRTIWGGECFYIFDDARVHSELWTGAFRTTRRGEIAFFVKVFTMLHEMAVHGQAARERITAARSRLPQSEAMS